MMLWRPDAPVTRRQINAYTAPRRASMRVESVALFLLLAGVRVWHLNKGRPADVARRLGRKQAALAADQARDAARIRAELRDRIDHCHEVGLDFEDIVRILAHSDPDAVNAALDEKDAPA